MTRLTGVTGTLAVHMLRVWHEWARSCEAPKRTVTAGSMGTANSGELSPAGSSCLVHRTRNTSHCWLNIREMCTSTCYTIELEMTDLHYTATPNAEDAAGMEALSLSK